MGITHYILKSSLPHGQREAKHATVKVVDIWPLHDRSNTI
jgi:hypothetical protein